MSTAARRARLDIGTLEPEPPIEGELFDTYRYRLKMCGAYNDIGQMLTNIGSLNRIVTAINLQLTLPQGCPDSPPGKQLLSSSFEIQMYVVRTAPKKGVKKLSPNAAAAAAATGGTPPGAPQARRLQNRNRPEAEHDAPTRARHRAPRHGRNSGVGANAAVYQRPN